MREKLNISHIHSERYIYLFALPFRFLLLLVQQRRRRRTKRKSAIAINAIFSLIFFGYDTYLLRLIKNSFYQIILNFSSRVLYSIFSNNIQLNELYWSNRRKSYSNTFPGRKNILRDLSFSSIFKNCHLAPKRLIFVTAAWLLICFQCTLEVKSQIYSGYPADKVYCHTEHCVSSLIRRLSHHHARKHHRRNHHDQC